MSFVSRIRSSDRVTSFVKEKQPIEIFSHYFLIEEETGYLTNLGVLFLGKQSQRGRLTHSLVVQCIKYDFQGRKVQKYLWDDFTMPPDKIIEDIWESIPDWKESNEISDGLFRREIPAYDKAVIRKLVSNAIVHRPYTISGDIFINIYPDKVEVVNPGSLPIGVTPQNILHKTVKRNEHFAAIFAAFNLMEREGSGYDKMYEIQLSNGKPIPEVVESEDSVKVVVKRQIINTESISIIQNILNRYDLTQKNIICLGFIVQYESLSASSLIKKLYLRDHKELSPWINNLISYGIVGSFGKNRAKEYRVNTDILRKAEYKGTTSLKRIEDYRIRELILEDLKIYQCASLGDIHSRIGKEIEKRKVKQQIFSLVNECKVKQIGNRRWTTYQLSVNTNSNNESIS